MAHPQWKRLSAAWGRILAAGKADLSEHTAFCSAFAAHGAAVERLWMSGKRKASVDSQMVELAEAYMDVEGISYMEAMRKVARNCPATYAVWREESYQPEER